MSRTFEHDGCIGCKYEKESETSDYCKGCKQNAVDKYVRMTNFDGIKDMNVEEMAIEFVCSYPVFSFDEVYINYRSIHDGADYTNREDAERAEQEWLEREVEE